jgi:hypothetical protein
VSTAQEEWDAAETGVREGADDLRAAQDHRAIRAWADEHNLVGRSQWPKVKTELRKQLGIDYEQLREDTLARESDELAAASEQAATVRLFVAADAEIGTYAISSASDDTEAWYNTFHSKDRTYRRNDDLSAERSALDKAVFLAGKVREALEVPAINLVAMTSHPDLTADDVAANAIRHKVALTVEHVEQNPAVALCAAAGYREWREIRLPSLVDAALDTAEQTA